MGYGVIGSLDAGRARRLEMLIGTLGMVEGRQNLLREGLAYQLRGVLMTTGPA